MEEDFWFVMFCLVLGVLLVIVFTTHNNIDVNKLGEYVCEHHNVTYIDSKLEYGTGGEINNLNIRCGKKESLVDGYLHIIK